MKSFTSVLSTVVALACAGGAPPSETDGPVPSTVRYAPHQASYELVSNRRVEQFLPTGSTTAESSYRVFLHTSLSEGSEGLGITITIDSVSEATGAGIPPTDVSLAGGTEFTGTVAPSGRLLGFSGGDTTNMLVRQLNQTLGEFLPQLPEGGAVPGVQWTDTAIIQTDNSGLAIEVRSVAAREVLPWTTFAGQDALHLVSRASYTLAGQGAQMGQAITLDGAGVREEHHFVSRAGAYLGAWASDSATIDALVTSVGTSIPIVQLRVDSVVYRPQ